jgi:hypothetical protein
MTSLPPPIQAVVALFRGPLSGVRFGDVDAGVLSSLAAEVESANAEIEAQQARLIELQQAVAQRQEVLLGLAQQALAYARIYAENDEVLTAELNQISLPRATKPRKPTKGSAAESGLAKEPAALEEQAPVASEELAQASSAAIPDADESDDESKPRLISKPKRRYSRVPPQSRAS